jgi:hypothetical protein
MIDRTGFLKFHPIKLFVFKVEWDGCEKESYELTAECLR